MKKAELMRNLTDKRNEERSKARIEKHKDYASKIMRKIRKEALKGHSIMEIITKTKFSIVLIGDILRDNGFSVTEAKARNGKNMLVIKW